MSGEGVNKCHSELGGIVTEFRVPTGTDYPTSVSRPRSSCRPSHHCFDDDTDLVVSFITLSSFSKEMAFAMLHKFLYQSFDSYAKITGSRELNDYRWNPRIDGAKSFAAGFPPKQRVEL